MAASGRASWFDSEHPSKLASGVNQFLGAKSPSQIFAFSKVTPPWKSGRLVHQALLKSEICIDNPHFKQVKSLSASLRYGMHICCHPCNGVRMAGYVTCANQDIGPVPLLLGTGRQCWPQLLKTGKIREYWKRGIFNPSGVMWWWRCLTENMGRYAANQLCWWTPTSVCLQNL